MDPDTFRMLSDTKDTHYSSNKQLWTFSTLTLKHLLLQNATFHSPRPIFDWKVFVSLPLSPGVCLPDTCLAWPSFAFISSVTGRTCEGHLAVLLCESLSTLCLCQQLGTDAHPRSPYSRTYWATTAHLPQADGLICMSINHSWN